MASARAIIIIIWLVPGLYMASARAMHKARASDRTRVTVIRIALGPGL